MAKLNRITLCAVCLFMLMACGEKLSPEEVALAEAKKTVQTSYEQLLAGNYDSFLEGRSGNSSLPESYREQLRASSKQFVARWPARETTSRYPFLQREQCPDRFGAAAHSGVPDTELRRLYPRGDCSADDGAGRCLENEIREKLKIGECLSRLHAFPSASRWQK